MLRSAPKTLPSPSTMLHLNVDLYSDNSDEVIGYKSPVFQDNSLAWGQVWEPSISRNAFPWHVWDHINRWGRNNWRVGGCCLLLCQGESSVPVLQERIWILHEKHFVIIRSFGFCAVLSIHTHLLELHCLRGSTTKKKPDVLKFLELSLSTMPPTLSWVWVPRFLVLKLNSWQTYVVLNSTHCNQERSWFPFECIHKTYSGIDLEIDHSKCHSLQSNRHGFSNRLKCHLLQSIILSLSLTTVNVIDYHFHWL